MAILARTEHTATRARHLLLERRLDAVFRAVDLELLALVVPMCNHRGIKDWSEIPRTLAKKLLNFDYNPNVAPTEQVPAFLAERGKPLETKMARFGIVFAPGAGKKRAPLLNVRTYSLRRGSLSRCWPTATA